MSAHIRVLVLGASGTLGSQVGTALETAGFEVLRGVRSPLRPGDVPVDIHDRRSLESATAHVDLVVVAVPHTDPLVQQVCAQAAVPCLDVSPHLELRDSARRTLREQGPASIVMCGLYPGLSGILASHVAAGLDEVEEISVGLLQSTNARVGPAGVRDMLASLARPVPESGGMAPGSSRAWCAAPSTSLPGTTHARRKPCTCAPRRMAPDRAVAPLGRLRSRPRVTTARLP